MTTPAHQPTILVVDDTEVNRDVLARHLRRHDCYHFKERGEVRIKGKGKIRTYFLQGRKG